MAEVTVKNLTREQIDECMHWAVQSGRYMLANDCALALSDGRRTKCRRGAKQAARERIARNINYRARREGSK